MTDGAAQATTASAQIDKSGVPCRNDVKDAAEGSVVIANDVGGPLAAHQRMRPRQW